MHIIFILLYIILINFNKQLYITYNFVYIYNTLSFSKFKMNQFNDNYPIQLIERKLNVEWNKKDTSLKGFNRVFAFNKVRRLLPLRSSFRYKLLYLTISNPFLPLHPLFFNSSIRVYKTVLIRFKKRHIGGRRSIILITMLVQV